jgi:hypothetical protein
MDTKVNEKKLGKTEYKAFVMEYILLRGMR